MVLNDWILLLHSYWFRWIYLFLWSSAEITQLPMWSTQRMIRALKIMPLGARSVCHCLASFFVLRWTRKPDPARPSVWCVWTEWLIRLGRLAAHLISVLLLLGTFSSQWAISWPNDGHRRHHSSAAAYKALCKAEYPSQDRSFQSFCTRCPLLRLLKSAVQGGAFISVVHFKGNQPLRVTKDNGFQLEWRILGKSNVRMSRHKCLFVAMIPETTAWPRKREESTNANETLLWSGD